MATKLNVGDMYGPMYIESIDGNEVVARCMMCFNGIIFTNFKDEDIISTMEHHICKVTSAFYDGKKIGSYILVNLKELEDGAYTGIAKCTICNKKFTFTGTPELLIPALISMSCDFFKPDITPIPSDANFTTIKKNPLRLQYKIDIESKIKELQNSAQLLQIEQIIEDYKNNSSTEENPEEKPIIPDDPNIPEDDELDRPITNPEEYYSITINKLKYGDVEINKNEAKPDDEIIITLIPDEGYEVQSINVDDEEGDEIQVFNKGNNKYTFIMPSMDVSIEIKYKAIVEEEEEEE